MMGYATKTDDGGSNRLSTKTYDGDKQIDAPVYRLTRLMTARYMLSMIDRDDDTSKRLTGSGDQKCKNNAIPATRADEPNDAIPALELCRQRPDDWKMRMPASR